MVTQNIPIPIIKLEKVASSGICRLVDGADNVERLGTQQRLYFAVESLLCIWRKGRPKLATPHSCVPNYRQRLVELTFDRSFGLDSDSNEDIKI